MTLVKPCSHECADLPKFLGLSGVSYFTKSSCFVSLLHWLAADTPSEDFLSSYRDRNLGCWPDNLRFWFCTRNCFPGLLKAHTLRSFLSPSLPKTELIGTSASAAELKFSSAAAAPPDKLSLPAFLAHCSWGNLFCSSSQSIVHIPEIIFSHLSPRAT